MIQYKTVSKRHPYQSSLYNARIIVLITCREIYFNIRHAKGLYNFGNRIQKHCWLCNSHSHISCFVSCIISIDHLRRWARIERHMSLHHNVLYKKTATSLYYLICKLIHYISVCILQFFINNNKTRGYTTFIVNWDMHWSQRFF